MKNKINKKLLIIFIIILIFGFYSRITLLSTIKETELHESNNYIIYDLNNNIIYNKDINTSITFDAKLKNKFIIPYIYNYSINSWFYDYSINIFWNFDDINDIKTYIKIDNDISSKNVINIEKINKIIQNDWNLRVLVSNDKIFINNIKNKKIKFIIEFKWIKDWKEDYYKIEKELDIEEKKYFWNSLIYILSRN